MKRVAYRAVAHVALAQHVAQSLEGRHHDRRLARGRDTLAVYMGVGTLETLVRELVAHGREPSTPVAFVENGSRPTQRVLVGTLASAVDLAAEHRLESPALLIVGEVAALARTLSWFGTAPLTASATAARAAA